VDESISEWSNSNKNEPVNPTSKNYVLRSKLLTFAPVLVANLSDANATKQEIIPKEKFNSNLNILTKALKSYIDQESNESFLTLLNETSLQLESYLVSKIKYYIQSNLPYLYTNSMNNANDLTDFYNVISPVLYDSYVDSLQTSGIPDLTYLPVKFFWTYVQTFDIEEAFACIKEDFNLTLIENSITSSLSNAFNDYLKVKGLFEIKPFVEIFLKTFMETKSLTQALECLDLKTIEPNVESLMINQLKKFLREFYQIQNVTSLDNLREILLNVTKLTDLSAMMQSFCESYSNDPMAAFKTFTKNLTSLFEDSNVLLQFLNESNMNGLVEICSNFLNAFMLNMNIQEGLEAISESLMAFIESQLVVCLKKAVLDYSSSLYELIRDETDLAYIIEILSPFMDMFMQLKLSDLGLAEVSALFKKFYATFSQTLDFDYSVDCVMLDLELVLQNRSLGYLKLFFWSFSPQVFSLIQNLDFDGIKNNAELIRE
jgi:hypothetical protein